MDYVIAFLLFGGLFAIMIYAIIEQNKEFSQKPTIEIPDEILLPDNSIEAYRKARSFLSKRLMDAQGIAFVTKNFEKSNFLNTLEEDSHDLPDYFRYIHLSGYRIKLVKETSIKEEKTDEYHMTIDKANEIRLQKIYDKL